MSNHSNSDSNNISSAIYESKVIHTRLKGYKTGFSYKIFTFFLDLDDLDSLSERNLLFKRNRFSLFSFYDRDHLQWNGSSVKENIINYLRDAGYQGEVGKIFLLTNLRVLGYVFNPVSFYYIFDRKGNPITSIAEVGNTFGERKPYYFGIQSVRESNQYRFRLETDKYFYVSPFIKLDSRFDFKLEIPGDDLKVQVDSWEEGQKTLGTAYVGKKKEFHDKNLLFYFLKYPLVTVKIIGAIHYRALVLWIKKLRFLRKSENPEQQIGVQFGKGH